MRDVCRRFAEDIRKELARTGVELTDDELRALVVQARRLQARNQRGSWALTEEQLKEIDEMTFSGDGGGKRGAGVATKGETEEEETEEESTAEEKEEEKSLQGTGAYDIEARRATDKLTRVAGMKLRRAKLRAINRGSMKACPLDLDRMSAGTVPQFWWSL